MTAPPQPLAPEAFAGECLAVARRLLGCHLVRGEVVVRITEVEAYRWPDDSANHCFRGRTPRNAPMFGPPGTAYVYRCYGVHQMLNLVTQPAGEGAAVLIRAAEPVAGHGIIASRRGGRTGPDSLAGPGRLAAALAIDGALNGRSVCAPGELQVCAGRPPERVRCGPRVGIDYAEPAHRDAPWRLAVTDSAWVSHPARFTHEEQR